jgi:lysophospholipase L1-like esterase
MKQKNILCYGDSNTWGYDPINACRYGRDVRWTGGFQNELGDDYYVIEEGLCGRTTVWDDPIEGWKNGLEQLIPILHSNCPLDLVIIMLGTNDLKNRFSVSASDIAKSIGRLVDTVRKCESSYTGPAPDVLVISPAPFGDMSNSPFADSLIGGKEKSHALAAVLAVYCKENDIEMFDAGTVISLSDADGIHLEEPEHLKLGKAIAEKVRKQLQSS